MTNKEKIKLPIWQVVRLFSGLEALLEENKSPKIEAVFEDWEEFWVSLDAQLEQLALDDFEHYARTMMQGHRDLDLSSQTRDAFLLALSKVQEEIKKTLREASAESHKDLSYEQRELSKLKKTLESLKL